MLGRRVNTWRPFFDDTSSIRKMEKIVIACDSFKGSLSSDQVNAAAAAGIRRRTTSATTICIPLADGGEGTIAAIAASVNDAEIIYHNAADPLGNVIQAPICLIDNGATAIIESAATAGLTLLPPRHRNPLLTSTYGVGQQIIHAVSLGCRNIVIGLGGSATNDGGTGMLQALGVRFYDTNGTLIVARGGAILSDINVIDTSQMLRLPAGTRITALCDVSNPIIGPNGATYVFGSQKGADKNMLLQLEKGMVHYADIVSAVINKDISTTVGGGAAGGLAMALMSFFNAQLKPGIATLLDMIHFNDILTNATLVITGEGHIDAQTLMGKAPMGIMLAANNANVPTIAIAGEVSNRDELIAAGFTDVLQISDSSLPLEVRMDSNFAKERIADTCQKAYESLVK